VMLPLGLLGKNGLEIETLQLTDLRDRQASKFHELVDREGARAHELLVKSCGSLCTQCLMPRDQYMARQLSS